MRFGEYIIMEYILLEDCCEILDYMRIPITASSREKGIYPYYGANGIQDYVSSYIFDDDLVLLAEDGGSFGSKTKPIAYRVSGKCWVNNHAHVLKPKEGMDVDFLCYSLMFYNTEGLINGATRQKLTQSAMRKMKIPKLHIDIQQKIVKEIKSVKSIIEISGKQLEKLSLLVRARFVEMFGDTIINSRGLNTLAMSEICEIIDGDRGKNYPTADEFYDEGYCLFLNAKNVTSKGFCFDDCMFISKEKNKLLRNGKLNRGDIVLTTRGTLGNLAFYGDNISFENIRINSGMVILRMRNDIMNEIYFIEQFKMKLDYIKKQVASGSAQPQLPISTIKKIHILIPDIEKQRGFVEFVQQVNKSKVEVQKALDKAQLLFDSLMQKYFG
nr:restriction endonuclease subunit S [uncultured Lachnoanaerobaculum sp.]